MKKLFILLTLLLSITSITANASCRASFEDKLQERHAISKVMALTGVGTKEKL